MDLATMNMIEKAFDPKNAIRIADQFYRTDRQFTFSAFHKTTQTAVKEMKAAGLKDVEVHEFPADGKTFNGDWRVPRAWDVKRSTLSVKTGGKYVTIADRKQDLCSTIMYSAATPGRKPCSCSIVSSKDKKNWQGNLVFLEGGASLKKLAAKGALGIITDNMPLWKHCRSREDVYDICLWNNAYLAPANDFGLVGFQVTPRNGDLLRKHLAKGAPLPAKAHVDSRLYDGTLDFVTGVLPGMANEKEEVAFFAHLYEVGAHDNASGCAAAIEVCRTLKKLIKQKKLKPLRRSIRLCFTFEIHGSLAYYEKYPERARPIVAALNPDMVGADLDKIKSRMQVHINPDSVPSYTDALITHCMARAYNRPYLLRWSERPYMINDNIVADPVLNIPCPALIELRDRYYHSSGDVPANLDPVSMEAVGTAMAAYTYLIGRGAAKEALSLVDMVLTRELKSLSAPLHGAARPPAAGLLDYRLKVAVARLKSIKTFLKEPAAKAELNKYINKGIKSLTAFATERKKAFKGSKSDSKWQTILAPAAALKKEAAALFPKKKRVGTFTYGSLSKKERQGLPPGSAWGYQGNAPMFWADGSRSLLEIWENCCMETEHPHRLQTTLDLFTRLEEYGYVTIRKK